MTSRYPMAFVGFLVATMSIFSRSFPPLSDTSSAQAYTFPNRTNSSTEPTPTPRIPGLPEGRIAFESNRRDGSSYDIYVMNSDGSDLTLLTDNPGNDYTPSWSPDGKRIAFCSFWKEEDPTQSEIYVMNADGSGVTNLTNNIGDDCDPAWSPDGTRIAFASDRDFPYQATKEAIYVMNADGSNPVKLTQNWLGGVLDIRWRSDGKYLIFGADNQRDDTFEWYIMRSDGSDVTPVESWEGDGRSLRWGQLSSPDGKWVVHACDGTWNICLFNTDDEESFNLTDSQAYDHRPAWFSQVSAGFVPSPQITAPADGTRVFHCQVDVSGSAEPGSEVHLRTINHFPGPDQEHIGFSEEIGTTTANDDGTWRIAQAPLLWEDNYLHADAEKDGIESDISSYMHVLCRRPRVIYNAPPDATDLIAYDLSGDTTIAFRFDVPMDPTSINSQTVRLSSEFLEEVPVTITHDILPGDEQPTYFLDPHITLRQATAYTVYLADDIRAAPPEESAHILSYHWQFKTTGSERERLVQAIRDLADRACEKIDRDVETTANAFISISEIERNMKWAIQARGILSALSYLSKAPKSFIGSGKETFEAFEEGLKSFKTVLIETSLAGLSLHGAVSDVGAIGESSIRWSDAALTEDDLELYEDALKESDDDTDLVRNAVELLLLGADRPSPLRIPVPDATGGDDPARLVEGASSIKRSIRQEAENLIAMLPDPLPLGFPTHEICDQISDINSDLMRSTTHRVTIDYPDQEEQKQNPLTIAQTKLGHIGARMRESNRWHKEFERRNRVTMYVTVYDAVSTAVSVVMQASGPNTWVSWEWDLEPIDGLIDLLGLYEQLSADPRDLLRQMPAVMLNELPREISETYRLTSNVYETILEEDRKETNRAPKRNSFLALWPASPVYADELSTETNLSINSLDLEDITVATDQPIGAGSGQCTVVNNTTTPMRVHVRVHIRPLNPIGEERPQLGKGRSPVWTTVMPNAKADLAVDYQVLAPGLTGQVDLQALVTLDAVPTNGDWPRTVGPFSQIIRVGTEEHLKDMPALDTETLLTGELEIGEIHTQTLTLPANAQPINLLLSHSPRISLAMRLEDQAGDRIVIDGMGHPAQFDGLTGTHASGLGYHLVSLDESPTGSLLLTVQGVVSKRGEGLRYEVERVSGPARSVIMELLTDSEEDARKAVSGRGDGTEEQTRLPWMTIGLIGVGILAVVGAAIAIMRKR